MRSYLLSLAMLWLFALPASAQTPLPNVDEIIAKYLKTIGGAAKVEAVKSVRRTGKFTGGGGFEAAIVEENKRAEMVRQEVTFGGMTGVNAYDGKVGWKIEPWGGKKDVETLSEEELKNMIESADFDGPLVNYRQKGHQVELLGKDEVEGTDVFKLKVTRKNGDVNLYFMDTDYYVPIKIETKRIVRGAEQEFETSLGDYKEVAGVYWPHSFENGMKGSANKSQLVYDKIEANVNLDDSRFHKPAPKAEGGKQ
jgi:hypothetical protein